MDETMAVTQARKELLTLVDEVAAFGKVVTITKNGVAKAVLMAKDEIEGLVETIAIMSDRKLVKHIKEGMREAERGETIPWEEVKKQLNL